MPFDSRVFRVLIASPSDVEEEREIAVRVIQAWNDIYSYVRKVVILPLRWETHSAPEYGTRPQEVINRDVVDQCDLLIGIFWTRIGSPTGIAESGTIEEIERVAKAGKPVMLYFSRMGAIPDLIDVPQLERLNAFKARVKNQALVEDYKSHLDFRDKLSKQIEFRVRDLQKNDDKHQASIALDLVSPADGTLAGLELRTVCNVKTVSDLSMVAPEHLKAVDEALQWSRRRSLTIPVALVVSNVTFVGVRNLFVEVVISANQDVTLGDSFPRNPIILNPISFSWTALSMGGAIVEQPQEPEILRHLESEGLTRTDSAWKLAFECEALQPGRKRVIKPVLYATVSKSCVIRLSVKVFADSFPEPLSFDAKITAEILEEAAALKEVLPNWVMPFGNSFTSSEWTR